MAKYKDFVDGHELQHVITSLWTIRQFLTLF